MPLYIIQNDITKMKTDAIVNAANNSLLGGGGVDGAIHRAAGRKLLEECRTLGGCETGKAKITKAYNLPCKHVIHTVGPIWDGGGYGEKELLESCYRESLKIALEYSLESIAFPLISAGVYGYPKGKALEVARNTIADFLNDHDMTVYIVLLNRDIGIEKPEIDELNEYLNRSDDLCLPKAVFCRSTKRAEDFCEYMSMGMPIEAPIPEELADKVKFKDKGFSETLLDLIDKKGLTDTQCYKKANVDRKLFSKIRSSKGYKPSKSTALSFAIALELSVEETENLLSTAGFALSRSNIADIIIRYFIEHKNYNIYEINEILFAYDQSLLGL